MSIASPAACLGETHHSCLKAFGSRSGDRTQAHEIFKSHNLPGEGCNLYTLAKNFLDTNDGVLNRRKGPPINQSQPTGQLDPFKLARLPDNAWREHRQTGAAGAPFAVTLPPIASPPKA